MANTITKIVDRDPVREEIIAATSRYASMSMIYYGELNKITFPIYKRNNYIKSNQSDRFMVIRGGHEYRPDLVSQEVYGTTDFWWKIMEYNGMKDIMEFKIGVNLILPADILF